MFWNIGSGGIDIFLVLKLMIVVPNISTGKGHKRIHEAVNRALLPGMCFTKVKGVIF